MKRISVGQQLYIGVISVFLLFAIAFIIYQQAREKHYKIEMLNLRLQDYNARMDEDLHYLGNKNEKTLQKYIDSHPLPSLRVTLIDRKGRVFFDNSRKDYSKFSNHANRPEVKQAFSHGSGSVVDRNSKTLKGDFFYSATYFPADSLVIRTALPYNSYLSKSLQTDKRHLWVAIFAIIILVILLYRFTKRLGKNITKLRIFASRADHNESLDVEDLIDFPNDELGEIAEKIIKLYKRLQSTREEQNMLKRQLTQNIAHELKTPVASIQGYLETIQENPNIDEATKEQFLDRCFAQSKRLTSLLQDISTLNRMDDAPDIKDFTDVNISAIVKNIIKETSLERESKKMNFTNDLPENIIIKGNQSLLYSVFRNLTDNSIAYAGTETTITLEAQEEEKRWLFTFMDNGIGVPHQHLSRLFERFYRVDKGRSRKMGGTGLGLAIVKNSVILHGGTISVKNNPNGGLRFDFSLKK